MPAIDRLIEVLCAHGAKGTRDRLHAFGLHLNPKAAAYDAGYLLDQKAFALLAPWLRSEIDVDLARRLSPSVAPPYPPAYVRRLVDPACRPLLPELIDDHLAWNPTRYRERGMLPLFAHLDSDRVARGASGHRAKARPAGGGPRMGPLGPGSRGRGRPGLADRCPVAPGVPGA